MRAMTYEHYGSPVVLELRDAPVPTPGDRDLLIRVRAVSINASDWETLCGRPLYTRIGGPLRPRYPILGSDVAGVVESVGGRVKGYRAGDEVITDLLYHGFGGFADYVIAPDRAPIVHKPANLTFAEAATLPQAGVIALQALGNPPDGCRVLINGAGGGSGTFTLQLAKSRGASVTAVDNGYKADYLRSLGADGVIDYTVTDYTRTGDEYDHIVDLAGHRSLWSVRRALAPGGTYSLVGGSVSAILQGGALGPVISHLGSRRMRLVVIRPGAKALESVLGSVGEGSLRPVIDTVYPLEGLPAALSHVGEGRALGKVVVTVSED